MYDDEKIELDMRDSCYRCGCLELGDDCTQDICNAANCEINEARADCELCYATPREYMNLHAIWICDFWIKYYAYRGLDEQSRWWQNQRKVLAMTPEEIADEDYYERMQRC